jgi:hypothetical protein
VALEKYKKAREPEALHLLLDYNKEDVVKLTRLEEIIDELGGGALDRAALEIDSRYNRISGS